ncbi:hypothetical protein GCM10010270_17110 [Streptomyces violaceus]|nr:hypothetical protein GCM10010270_17110 [Streptomyces janthinus]
MRIQIDAISGVGSIAVAQPEYLRIAADLRRRIAPGGEFEPGDRIPTLPELCTHYAVSEITVRNAIRLLVGEGLLESRARAGTIVRKRPAIHRMPADRYRQTPGVRSTPYTRDQGIAWSEYRLDKRFERVQADAEMAALFECEVGERLLARHFVFYDNDVASQMSTSYVRWSDVAGTPVADPINEPWPGGTRAQLGSLGIRVTQVTESFTAPCRPSWRRPRSGSAPACLCCGTPAGTSPTRAASSRSPTRSCGVATPPSSTSASTWTTETGHDERAPSRPQARGGPSFMGTDGGAGRGRA